MEEAQKDYKDALKNMPGACSLIGMTLTDSICTTLLPLISVAGVAAAAGAAMSSMGFLNSAGALAKQAGKMMETKGSNASCLSDVDNQGKKPQQESALFYSITFYYVVKPNKEPP